MAPSLGKAAAIGIAMLAIAGHAIPLGEPGFDGGAGNVAEVSQIQPLETTIRC